MNMNISNDALIEALRNARVAETPEDDPGYSTYELSKELGCSQESVRKMLKHLHRQGKLAVGKRYSVDIVGRRCATPVYRLRELC